MALTVAPADSAVQNASAPSGPSPRPPGAHAAARRLRVVLPPLLLILAGLAIWQLVVSVNHTDPQLLPGPWLILRSTWDNRANIWPAIVVTTEEAVLGMAVATVTAVLVAVAIDSFRTVRSSLYPVIIASQTVPIIALAPLVLVWWGFGLFPKVALVALFSFFPIAVGMVQGLGSAEPDAINLLRTMRAGRWQLLTRVKLPNSLPQFFTGLKISVTYAYSAAIVAEYVGATQGLGYYMQSAVNNAPVRMDLVLGAVFVIALLTILLFGMVGIVQRLAMPWRPRP
ncbi:MAG TPA: ABC transporter permease [Acidimicrobiales bacterium]|nr:ABC transporter permease [Acidimicrobiales bacterium]